jgi:phosphoglycerate dehydrogenase-like enzyme
MIGAREISLLRPGAFIVNTARGDIVQKAPVFAALRTGHLGGAGLDVVEAEPLRTAEEAATPNLIVTCHAAFCSPEGMVDAHHLGPPRPRRRYQPTALEPRELETGSG